MATRILILDDMPARHEVLARRYPDAERVHVHTFGEAVSALATGRFDLVLLDHDLGEERTGYHVALAIADLPPELLPLDAVVHSHNPVGAERMRDVLADAGVRARLEPFSSHMRTEVLVRPATMREASAEKLAALVDACRALPDALALESVIANLRVAGSTKVETIFVLHQTRGLSVADAKAAIDRSEAWIDRREADAALHDALIEVAERLVASAGGKRS